MQSLQDCLGAVCDVIKAQQPKGTEHEPTPTEYFAVVTTVLASGSAGDKLPSFLKVLLAVIPSTASEIVKSQFQPLIRTLMGVVKSNSENAQILSSALACMGKLLLEQDKSEGFWENVNAFQAVNGILAFIDDDNPKVRKTTHEAITNLVISHHQHRLTTFRSYFADFIIGINKSCTRSNYKRSHCLILLLESIFIYMPANSIRKIMDSCIKLQLSEIPKLTSAVYRTFDTLFQHSLYAFSYETTLSLLQSLLKSTLITPDIEAQGYYLSCITSALILFSKLFTQQIDYAIVIVLVQKIFTILLTGAESEFLQIHIAIMSNVKRIVQYFFSNKTIIQAVYTWYHQMMGASKQTISLKQLPGLITEYINQASVSGVTVSAANEQGIALLGIGLFVEVVQFYEKLLAVKHQSLWNSLLDNIRYVMDACKLFHTLPHTITTSKGVTITVPNSIHNVAQRAKEDEVIVYFLQGIMQRLVDVYATIDNHTLSLDTSTIQGLLDTIGYLLSIVSLSTFLKIVPIIATSDTTNGTTGSEGMALKVHDWVLQLLHYEIKHQSMSHISDFVVYFLPLATKLHKLRSSLRQQLIVVQAAAAANATATTGKKQKKVTIVANDTVTTQKEQALALQSKLLQNKIIQLWSLFPEICRHRNIVDYTDSYPKLLSIVKGILSSPEDDYPEIKFFLILGLKHLGNYVLQSLQGTSSSDTGTVMTHQSYYTATANATGVTANQFILSTATNALIPLILQYTEEINFSDSKFQEVLHCLKVYLPFTSDSIIKKITKKLLQFVLVNTTTTRQKDEAEAAMDVTDGSNVHDKKKPPSIDEQVSVSMAILLAMIPYLTPALLPIFYKTIQPLLTISSESIQLQKRAYHILYTMLQYHLPMFFPTMNTLQAAASTTTPTAHSIAIVTVQRGMLDEAGNPLLPTKLALLQILNDSILNTHISSRNMRLKCMYLLIHSMTKAYTPTTFSTVYQEVADSFLLIRNELVICLKDSNKKTRDQALQILFLFSNALSNCELLQGLYQGIAGAETPTLRAAFLFAICNHFLHQYHLYGQFAQAQQAAALKKAGKNKHSAASALMSGKRGRDEEEEDDMHDDEEDSEEEDDDEEDVGDDGSSVPEEEEEDGYAAGQAMISKQNQGQLYTLLHEGLVQLPHIAALFVQEHSEQTKMCLYYYKLMISMHSRDDLAPHLSLLLQSMTHRAHIGEKYKSKYLTVIKNLLRKCMKKFTYEELSMHLLKHGNGNGHGKEMNDMPLLDALYKQQRKQIIRKEAAKNGGQSKKNEIGKGLGREGQGNALQQYYEEMLLHSDEDEDEENDEENENGDGGLTAEGKSRMTVEKRSLWEKRTLRSRLSAYTKMTGKTAGTRMTNGNGYSGKSQRPGAGATEVDFDEDFEDEDDEEERDYRMMKQYKVKGVKAKEQLAKSNLTLDALLEDTLPQHLGDLSVYSRQKKTQDEEDDEEDGHGDGPKKKKARGGPQDTILRGAASKGLKLSSMHLQEGMNKLVSGGGGGGEDEEERYQVTVNDAGKVVIKEKPGDMLSRRGKGSVAGQTNAEKTPSQADRRETGSTGTKRTSVSRVEQKRQRLFKHLKDPGSEYKPKKGVGGDLWKKNTATQPHAYIPLDPRLLSKKHRDVALEHFGKVVANKHPKQAKQMVDKRKKVVAKRRN